KKMDYQARPTECFEFRWRRREKGTGFHWERDPKFGWLLLGPPDEDLLEYEPLAQETGLFLNFAHLDHSKKDFLQFANKYGRLGTYHQLGPEHGEPLDEWQDHHRWMRFLTELRSECLKDQPDLDGIMSWEGEEVLFRYPKTGAGRTEPW